MTESGFNFMLLAVFIFIFAILGAASVFLFIFLRPIFVSIFQKAKILKAVRLILQNPATKENNQEQIFALLKEGINDPEIVRQANLEINAARKKAKEGLNKPLKPKKGWSLFRWREKDDSKIVKRENRGVEEGTGRREAEGGSAGVGSPGVPGGGISGGESGSGKDIKGSDVAEGSRSVPQGPSRENKPRSGYFD